MSVPARPWEMPEAVDTSAAVAFQLSLASSATSQFSLYLRLVNSAMNSSRCADAEAVARVHAETAAAISVSLSCARCAESGKPSNIPEF